MDGRHRRPQVTVRDRCIQALICFRHHAGAGHRVGTPFGCTFDIVVKVIALRQNLFRQKHHCCDDEK